GPTRVDSDITAALTRRLQNELSQPVPQRPSGRLAGIWGTLTGAAERRQAVVKRRIAAATALSRIESGTFGSNSPYWSVPYGEPQWVTIHAGEFWMGSADDDPYASSVEKPAHRLFLPEFQIARTPI